MTKEVKEGTRVVQNRKGKSSPQGTVGVLERIEYIDSDEYYFVRTTEGELIGPSASSYWNVYGGPDRIIDINNWSLLSRKAEAWTSPELRHAYLHGTVKNHPAHPDGKIISTSPVRRIEDGMVVTESGSYYRLGDAESIFEQMFPNAKERLLSIYSKI
jgi:hypothetical protein